MNKKIIAILILIVLIPLAVNQYSKSKVVGEVETFLADPSNPVNVTAEKINYSIFTGKLSLDGVTLSESGEELFTLDTFVIDGYSTDSLDANNGDYPLVADNITFTNFKPVDSPASSIASFSIKGWKQNIALLEEAVQAQDFYTLIARASTLTFDSLEINGIEIISEYEDEVKLGAFSIMPTQTGYYNLNASAFSYEDDYSFVAFDEANVVNAPTLSKEAIAELLELAVEYGPDYALSSISSYMYSSFSEATLEQTLSVKGISMKDRYDGTLTMNIKELSQVTTNGGRNVEFSLDTFSMPEIFDEDMKKVMKRDALVMDIDGTVALNEELTALDMNVNTNVHDFLDIIIDTDLTFPISYTEFMDGIVQEDLMVIFAMFGTQVNELSIEANDTGLIPRMVALAQYTVADFSEGSEELSVEEALASAVEEIQYLGEDMLYMGFPQQFVSEFVTALHHQIHFPGTVKFDLTAKGATIDELTNMFMMNNEVPVSVTHTAGAKDTNTLVNELNQQ